MAIAAEAVAVAPISAVTVQELGAGEWEDVAASATAEAEDGVNGGAVAVRPWMDRLEALGIDRDTVPILLLILFHVTVSLIRGGTSLYALPIVTWIVVGAAVVARQAWSPALALVLVCTEIAFALYGIGPRTVGGLPFWAPIDFLMTFVRIVTGFLILRLRDQFE